MAYVVMRYNRWKNVEALTPFPLPVEGPGDGYLCVFDKLEDLKREYPDSPFIEVSTMPKKELKKWRQKHTKKLK